ncbi:hypothetical protein C370_07409 [Cryptococcus neoformans A1-35-8]|nr:hypothetical protein C370_07409 [Cryptococcus neoformans var. grubii A1-35-8]
MLPLRQTAAARRVFSRAPRLNHRPFTRSSPALLSKHSSLQLQPRPTARTYPSPSPLPVRRLAAICRGRGPRKSAASKAGGDEDVEMAKGGEEGDEVDEMASEDEGSGEEEA